MFKIIVLVLIFTIEAVHSSCRVYDFISHFDENDPTVLTDELPMVNGSIDFKLMPYVGNGHLASTIFNNAVFLNGLYNGQAGESHRARVPNIHNFSFVSSAGGYILNQYVIDFRNGLHFSLLILNSNLKITQK